jgi:hypothetical protein
MHGFAFVIGVVGVAVQRAMADADLVFDAEGYNRGRYGPNPHQYYYSTDIVSPLLLVNHWDPTKTDDAAYIFLTLDSPVDDGSAGPIIYRADDLSLVYSEPKWSVAHNAHISRFNGSDYLVFIEQARVANGPSTNCLLYDSTYALSYNISSHGPANASMGTHECQLTSDGSAVVVLTEITTYDLTAVGGPEDGKILDNIIQEIDIETDELLWTWRASEHYNLLDSYMEYKHGPGAYDYIHMNSVQKVSVPIVDIFRLRGGPLTHMAHTRLLMEISWSPLGISITLYAWIGKAATSSGPSAVRRTVSTTYQEATPQVSAGSIMPGLTMPLIPSSPCLTTTIT